MRWETPWRPNDNNGRRESADIDDNDDRGRGDPGASKDYGARDDHGSWDDHGQQGEDGGHDHRGNYGGHWGRGCAGGNNDGADSGNDEGGDVPTGPSHPGAPAPTPYGPDPVGPAPMGPDPTPADPTPTGPGQAPTDPTPGEPLAIHSGAYWLQDVNPAEVRASPFDLLAIDPMHWDDTPRYYTSAEVADMHGDHAGRVLLGYVSIGEAEDYRPYWQADWGQNPPDWFGNIDQQWGSTRVAFWEEEWQQIVLKEVDDVQAAGFDGVFLDVVDVYQSNWSMHANPNGAADMIEFVERISEHAKAVDPNFKIWVNSAEELFTDAGYVAAIDGALREDLYVNPDSGSASSQEDRDWANEYYDIVRAAGKPTLAVDYTDDPVLAHEAMAAARVDGFIPYIADADLQLATLNYTSVSDLL